MPLSAVDEATQTPEAAVNGNGDESIRPLCEALAARVDVFLEEEQKTEMSRNVQDQTRIALSVITAALEKYNLEEISISYNGGKDCLVLLVLFLCALASYPGPLPKRLQSVYIISQHPFAEVDSFVNTSVETYKLDLARYAMPMKAAFTQYLKDKPAVKAIFVGTRRTDPHGQLLTNFDQTDHGWPPFMRMHPVIDWHYAEIWTFIRQLKIPYCTLYDLGYTSLGGTTDTHPNPALKAQGRAEGKEEKFRPAYELVEDKAERLGREQ